MLGIDIETYSETSLPDCGVYKYAADPSFKILLFAYAIDDDPVQILDLANGDKIPKKIEELIKDTSYIKTAFNANFERVCLSRHYGEQLSPVNWECTRIKALTLGFPGSLDSASKALGFPQYKQKLMTGKNLIRLFCIPRKPSKNNNFQTSFLSDDKPTEWEQFKTYCIQDVVVEREIRKRLARYKMTQFEKSLWHLDQEINDRGVRIDAAFAQRAITMDDTYSDQLRRRYREVTGIANPNSVAQLKQWLTARLGFEVTKVTKETFAELKEAAGDKLDAIEAIQIRQEMAKTSTTKYGKMLDVINTDNRARGLLQFYGANRTGRWAGKLIQVQNLPQNKIKDLDVARQIVASGDLDTLEMVYDKVPNILSQLIRTAFIPSPGHKFVVSDFSAIEARVIAWLSGEAWRMDVFNTHGKIYEASASQMFKVPLEKIAKGNPEYALRAKGKVAELALGYQGGPGALEQMGALKMGLTEEELPDLVTQWRLANPHIITFWRDCENAAKEAIKKESIVEIQKGIKFIYQPGFLFIQLPSGRKVAYANPKLEKGRYGDKITYEGLEQTTNSWVTLETYGGKIVENIVQATARDCLAEAMVRLADAGYRIVMHVHDEVILDVPRDNQDALREVSDIMGRTIPWADGLPLRADGYECDYYKKD